MSKTYFDRESPLIIIRGIIKKKNERMLRFALDTGCSRTIIPFETAEAIGCNPAGSSYRTRIIIGSGIEIVPVVKLESIKALGEEVKNLDVACYDLPEEGFVDGLLGLDFLKKFKFIVDFSKGIIELI